ncbi:MAG: hypothetical protein M1514_00160 [Patescibacteria group bacterium]|nr:hypothetical protein [Patescibacteria group bacterium]
MTSLDILYLALAVGFLIFISFLSYVLWQTGMVLKSLQIILKDAEEVTKDIANLRNLFKIIAKGIFNKILFTCKKGGEEDVTSPWMPRNEK